MGKKLAREVFIVNGKRTPFAEWVGGRRGDGKTGGAFKNITAVELGAMATNAIIRDIPAAAIDHVIFANAEQTGYDAIFGARHVALRAGIPVEVPALTVNRICGSGLEVFRQGAFSILNEEADLVVAAGGENLSQAPFLIRRLREHFNPKEYLQYLKREGRNPDLNYFSGSNIWEKIKDLEVDDMFWTFLRDFYVNMLMAETAEKLAKVYGVDRAATDAWAFRSHILTQRAIEAGKMAEEIVPVEISTEEGEIVCARDDHYVPNCSFAGLSKLRPVFVEDGIVTAGNASGVVDGAAACLLASKRALRRYGLTPIGRIVGWANAGVDPVMMGIGPVPASLRVLEKVGLKKNEIDLWEVNEAFACQYLAVEKGLGLERAIVNVNGGAVGIGHPLAATGVRQVLTLLLELRRRQKRFGLATACIGGGQGMAVVVEAL